MDIRDKDGLPIKGRSPKKVIYWYYLHMYRKVFEASQEELLNRYFELSVQESLSEVDSEELDFILELAQHSRMLTILIHLVDQFVDESLERFDEGYTEEIEQSRTRSLEKILGGSAEHRATAQETTGSRATEYRAIEYRATAHQDSEETVHDGVSSARSAMALKTAFDINQPPISHTAKRANEPFVKLFPSLRRYCTDLIKIKPLRFSRQCLLCVAFSAVGALCSTYKDDIAKVARMLFSTVETPIAQTDAVTISSAQHNVINYISQKPSPSQECRNQSVGWINPVHDGDSTFYGETFESSEATAAHAFLPPGSKIHLKSRATSQPVVVEVNEKANEKTENLFVSYSAARQLGVVEAGVAPVTIEHVEVSPQEAALNENQRQQLAHFQKDCGSLVESR